MAGIKCAKFQGALPSFVATPEKKEEEEASKITFFCTKASTIHTYIHTYIHVAIG
jgi:hypothetical protein